MDYGSEMNFGSALLALQSGRKLRRQGWNNPDAFLIHVPGQYGVPLRAGTPYHKALGPVTVTINGHLDMIYPPTDARPEALCIPGWLASQTDMLADDWVVVP